MKRSGKFVLALALGTLGVFALGGSMVAAAGGDDDESERGGVLRAEAEIRGPSGSGTIGTVRFFQRAGARKAPTPPVLVVARVRGVTAGKHGFHIHERGVCEPPFESAGGHFDPGPFGHSAPVDQDHPYHLGDLPNLRARESGVGRLVTVTSRVTLSPGPLSVFAADGSAVIVHASEDRGQPGVMGASGEPRIACGVLRAVDADSDDDS